MAYGKINTTLRPDSFLKSSVILKIFALALQARAKNFSVTSDSKKLFTGVRETSIPYITFPVLLGRGASLPPASAVGSPESLVG